jgi:hypothetical protein
LTGAAVLGVAVAAITYVIIAADLTSISLLGLSSEYKQLLLTLLDQPQDLTSPFPPCAQPPLATFQTTSDGVPICPAAIAVGSDLSTCDLIDTSQVVPTYVWWGDDALTVKIGVVGGNAEEIGRWLEAPDRAALQTSSFDGLLDGIKTVSKTQCDGYALLTVHQHYFSR